MSAWHRASWMLALSVACSSPPVPTPAVSQADWDRARAALARARSLTAKNEYVEQISVAFKDPRTGKVFSGRGAIAVCPSLALRMILIGPAGATALDVWATADQWRFAIPPASILRRGGKDSPPELPIGFFRSWFLRRLQGEMLTVDGGEVLLRDGAATVRVGGLMSETPAPLKVLRREGTTIEALDVLDPGAHPPVGEKVRYRAIATGLEVEVEVLSLSPDPPDPEAFVDPDSPGAGG